MSNINILSFSHSIGSNRNTRQWCSLGQENLKREGDHEGQQEERATTKERTKEQKKTREKKEDRRETRLRMFRVWSFEDIWCISQSVTHNFSFRVSCFWIKPFKLLTCREKILLNKPQEG
jgi:hypothetical protein